MCRSGYSANGGVGKLAVSIDYLGALFSRMQFRNFGKRALTEGGSEGSAHTMTLNGQVGYKINQETRIVLQGFNILNTHAHAIDYFYTSRLPGEAQEGRADLHFHPIESRSVRVGLVVNY